MSDAIEALPDVKDGDRLAQEVQQRAEAMTRRGPDETDALARESLRSALEAVRRARPHVKQTEKDQAVEIARRAIDKIAPGQRSTVDLAYWEVARAMVVVTGGGTGDAKGSELSPLVARFAVEEPEAARLTGAQAIAAMGDALQQLPSGHAPTRELRKRADRLATAAALDYSEQLKQALSLVLDSLDRGALPPTEQSQLDRAKAAVDVIRADRPLELQHAAAAVALRLVTDAIALSVSVR
jgi:hypothetical protein